MRLCLFVHLYCPGLRIAVSDLLILSIIVYGADEGLSAGDIGPILVSEFPVPAHYGYPAPILLSNKSNAAFLVWAEDRDSVSAVIAYAANRYGVPLWDSSGVEICSGLEAKYGPHAVATPDGGLIVGWIERGAESWILAARKLDRYGSPAWQGKRTVISSALVDPEAFDMAADSRGGAFLVWRVRSGRSSAVFAARVSGNGSVVPAVNGVCISSRDRTVFGPRIASIGGESAIVTWMEYRGGDWDIAAQRIDARCLVRWKIGAVSVCSAEGDQGREDICGDGMGGVVVAWMDQREGNWDIYAQRLDGNGNSMWRTEGVKVSAATFDEGYPHVAMAGKGRVLVSWVSVSPEEEVTAEAKAADVDPYTLIFPIPYYSRRYIGGIGVGHLRGVEQNVSNFLFASCMEGEGRTGLHVAAVGSDGALLWGGSIRVNDAARSAWYESIVSSDEGSTMLGWMDREKDNTAVCAASIDGAGKFTFKSHDLIHGCGGSYISHTEVVCDGDNGAFLSWLAWTRYSVYLYLWRFERDGTEGFANFVDYSVVKSEVSIGLFWRADDALKHPVFSVERADSSGTFRKTDLVPRRKNGWRYGIVDSSVRPGEAYRYRVKLFSGGNGIRLFQTDPIKVPTVRAKLYQNYPNPFNSRTVIPYLVGEKGIVRIELFDISGRRIKTLMKGSTSVGYHRLYWMGDNDRGKKVSPGVYIVRLESAGSESARKVVLVR